MVGKYKPGSAWRRGHWDKWTFWRKVRHVVAVILALLFTLGMCIGFVWFVLTVFSIQGFLSQLRDIVLLDIAHWIFDKG